MRHLKRLPEPEVLSQKKQEWTQNFLNSGKSRPDNSKYAHKSIRESLNAMSFHKCFYCERKLKNMPSEVDHYIEVSEQPSLAFDWHNLYLACNHCNNKSTNKAIPNEDILNPCVHSDEEIMNHISFEDEQIISNNDSVKGRQTIQKYKLDSNSLDKVRYEHLKQFHKVLIQIQRICMAEGRKKMNEAEINVLKRFQQAEQPFSLMFKIVLAKHDVL